MTTKERLYYDLVTTYFEVVFEQDFYIFIARTIERLRNQKVEPKEAAGALHFALEEMRKS